MTATRKTADRSELSKGFTALFAIAHVGAFVVCLPLLSLLAPLKAAEIAPEATAALLSWAALCGALVASVVNIIGGTLSDRTTSRFGRRRPWMIGGAGLTLASYLAIFNANSPLTFIAGIIFFQAAFNLFLPALIALLPDEVPDRSKGRMASLMALGPPLGLGAGSMIAGTDALSFGLRFALLAGLFAALITPLLVLWKEPPANGSHGYRLESPTADQPALHHDFRLIWLSRLFTQIAIATSQGFILLFVADAMARGRSFPDSAPESLVGMAMLFSTTISIVTALTVGAVSDRMGRRKYFVVASGSLIAAGMAIIAALPDWSGIIAGQTLYGLGVGLYSSAEVALAAETLPSRRDAARDLAILNLGNTLPQAIAPAMAILLVNPDSGGFSSLFFIGGVCAATGGAIALRIHRK